MPAASYLKGNKLDVMAEIFTFACGKEENIKVYTQKNFIVFLYFLDVHVCMTLKLNCI